MNLTETSTNRNIIITHKTQKRLVSDIKDLIKDPLTDHGIYYVHDEEDMLKGYALIIGPTETIYEDGFFLFHFDFPHDYPFAPPKVSFKTGGQNIRFHPNLYRSGKVCLSLLNTWKGEGWTSCQTIRSILLALVTLFHNKPLLNEPGITEDHRDFKIYNDLIEYKIYEVAINGIASQQYLPSIFIPFYTFIKKHFLFKYEDIIKRIENKLVTHTQSYSLTCGIYRMSDIQIDYNKVKQYIKDTYDILKITENVINV